MITSHIEPCPQCKGIGVRYIRNASVKIDETTCELCQGAGAFIVKQERIKATKQELEKVKNTWQDERIY